MTLFSMTPPMTPPMTPLWPLWHHCDHSGITVPTLASLRPYWGPTEALLRSDMQLGGLQKIRKFAENPENAENTVKRRGTRDPDPYHGWPPGYAPPRHTHYPGYTHYPHRLLHRCTHGVRLSHTVWHRSPGFFWIQSPGQNTNLSKTTTF